MANAVYDIITDRIVKQLEQGVIPWRSPFAEYGKQPAAPINGEGRRYRGINWFLLNMTAWAEGYTDPRWITYRQAQAIGANVRKGEKATPVVFWKKAVKTAAGWKDAGREDDAVIILRYYSVFNVCQCEGLPFAIQTPARHDWNPLEAAEAIVAGMPKAPTIVHEGALASYSPSRDTVKMPERAYFPEPANYYATLFHELTHATGHEKRLGRLKGRGLEGFGTDPYAQEELVAELGAAFLCSEAGIAPATLENQAAYIGGWLKKLKNDPKAIVYAAAQAQKAADFIANRQQIEQETPEAPEKVHAAAVAA